MAVITYPSYRTPPDQRAAVRDVAALFEFNGLVLNDRLTPDRYVISSVDGIDEAKIRDSREDRPQETGEVPYDAFYGGKTITLTGRMESGNIHMLEQMKQDLRSAFGTLVEAPMKIRWFDLFDGFDDPKALAYYTAVNATGAFPIVSGGAVTFAVGAPGALTLLRNAEQRLYGDSRITLKIIPGVTVGTNSASIVCKYVNASTILSVVLRSESLLTTYGADTLGGGATGLTLVPGSPVWIRATTIGNSVTSEIWTRDPFSASETESPTASWTIDLREAVSTTTNPINPADGVGDRITGMVGLGINTTDPTWMVDDYRVESIYPGDVVIRCRSIEKQPSIKKTQSSRSMYTRDFQVSVQASDPRLRNQVGIKSSASPINASNIHGRVYAPRATSYSARTYPTAYITAITPLGVKVASAVPSFATFDNKGNCTADAILFVYGSISNPTITNLTTGATVQLNGTIPTGDRVSIGFDLQGQRSILNLAGQNLFSMLTAESEWIKLVAYEPNDIIISGSSFDERARLVVVGQHTFM